MVTVLNLAVCLFPNVTALDYQGPVELFGFLSKSVQQLKYIPDSPVNIGITYVAYTKDPVVPQSGPRIVPDTTYEDAIHGEQFDIIFVPGGMTSDSSETSDALHLTF